MLIFDCNYICYRAYFTQGQLSYDGDNTGIIFGFLQEMKRIIKKIKPKTVVFTWDTPKKHSVRRKFYAPYKMSEARKKSDLNADDYLQFSILEKRVLPKMGYKNVFSKKGLEADDLIASICFDHKTKDKIIVSSDSDLYQLLSPTTSMYLPAKKEFYTLENFKNIWNITPTSWPLVKAIAGCTTDNIQGVKGVAEKTATKFLLRQLNMKTKTYRSIERCSGVLIKRNMLLVGLPFDHELIPLKIKKSKPSLKAFKGICREYGFTSILREMKEWRKVLKLK